MRTILFVCSGNTCRSPLALAAWRAFGAPRLTEYTAASAGLFAASGAEISRSAQQMARLWGVDLSDHRARRLTLRLARQAYLICAMTPQQQRHIRDNLKIEPRRVHLLTDFSLDENAAPILDPVGGSYEAYETCGARIRESVEGLCRALSAGGLWNESESTP
jgi:protein-tyrosine phosphatase